MFMVEVNGEDVTLSDPDAAYAPDVRIANPNKESGYVSADDTPVSWLNSARISVDDEDDAVRCIVSVGDPRGGFCFTVRRLSDGRLVILTPHPGESLPHMATRALSPGTYEVGYYDPDAEDNYGGPVIFGDDEE